MHISRDISFARRDSRYGETRVLTDLGDVVGGHLARVGGRGILRLRASRVLIGLVVWGVVGVLQTLVRIMRLLGLFGLRVGRRLLVGGAAARGLEVRVVIGGARVRAALLVRLLLD